MREIQDLSVQPRPGTGKGPSYQTRQQSRVPAVVYGGDTEPETVSVDLQTLAWHIERGAFLTTLFQLSLEGKKTRVIPRAVQLDPVTDRPVHVDFMRLSEGATVRLAIPVRFKGQEVSPGLKRGGVLNIVRHSVEVLCTADRIPEYFQIDLTGMDIGDSIQGTEAVRVSQNVRQLTIAPLLGEAMRRISEERSVSSLFDYSAA